MSKDKLPVPYYPPDYTGYRLDQDEYGEPVSFESIPEPVKYELVLKRPQSSEVPFAEIFSLKAVFSLSDQEAYDAIMAAGNNTEGYTVYEGYLDHCDTKGLGLENVCTSLLHQGYPPVSIEAQILKKDNP